MCCGTFVHVVNVSGPFWSPLTGMSPDSNSSPVGLLDTNRVVLCSAFPRLNDRLNLCHLNIGSLVPKLDHIRYLFDDVQAHVIAFSETWLKSHHSDSLIGIPGYRVFRSDRFRRRGGGVALYIRTELSAKVVRRSESLLTDYILVELSLPSSKILLGVFYKPPLVGDLDVLEQLLVDISSSYSELIFMGDFNENILRGSSGFCRYCKNDSCSKCNFRNLLSSFDISSVGSEPTHFHNGTPSQLDLVLSNSPTGFSRFGQLSSSFSLISNHDILFASYLCHLPPAAPPPVMFRDFNSIDLSNLYSLASNMPWEDIYCMSDIDPMTDHFNTLSLDLFDRTVPFRRLVPDNVHRSRLWLNDDCRRAIALRDFLHRRRNVDPASFRRARNRANMIVRAAKSRYYGSKVNTALGSKRLWRNLRNIGLARSPSASSPLFDVEEYASHLRSTQDDLDPVRDTFASSCFGDIANFSFDCVQPADVVLAISRVKSNSVGVDGLPIRFIRLLLPVILPYLTHILNFAITSSSFPSAWKSSYIIPIRKRGGAVDDVRNFRPISILSAVSKVFELLIKDQIENHLSSSGLLCSLQSGFRASHSTSSALLKVTDDISGAIDGGGGAFLVLLDFSRAFDMVDHSLLCSKLCSFFRFHSTSSTLMAAYLSNRRSIVRIGESRSTPILFSAGVPQGSILGPLLFSLFINDLPSAIRHSSYHLYADDVQIYFPFKMPHVVEAVSNINSDLLTVSSWTLDNRLLLNPSKCQAILLTRNGAIGRYTLPPIMISNQIISLSSRVTSLGLVISHRLSWSEHCAKVIAKIFSILRSLWPLAHVTPLSIRIFLVRSLILPHVLYCDSVYALSLDSSCSRSLTSAFNACIRYVFLLKRFSSVSRFNDRILGCPLFDYLKFRSSLFIFKLRRSRVPSYLFSKLRFPRSSRSLDLIIPRHLTSFYSNSFFVGALREWNSLPPSVRGASSVETFGVKYWEFYHGSSSGV